MIFCLCCSLSNSLIFRCLGNRHIFAKHNARSWISTNPPSFIASWKTVPFRLKKNQISHTLQSVTQFPGPLRNFAWAFSSQWFVQPLNCYSICRLCLSFGTRVINKYFLNMISSQNISCRKFRILHWHYDHIKQQDLTGKNYTVVINALGCIFKVMLQN